MFFEIIAHFYFGDAILSRPKIPKFDLWGCATSGCKVRSSQTWAQKKALTTLINIRVHKRNANIRVHKRNAKLSKLVEKGGGGPRPLCPLFCPLFLSIFSILLSLGQSGQKSGQSGQKNSPKISNIKLLEKLGNKLWLEFINTYKLYIVLIHCTIVIIDIIWQYIND